MKLSFIVTSVSAAVLTTGGALVSCGADARLAVDFSSAALPCVSGVSFEGRAVDTWGAQGRGAYRFTVTKPWQGGYPEWPSVTFPSAVGDWTGYDRLVVDVLSVGLGGDFFMGFVSDSSGHVGAGMPYPPLQLKTDDWQRWVIPLDWRKGQRGKAGKNPVDVRNITRVHFNFTTPFVADVEISGLYLLKPGDPLPEPCAEYLREKANPARERARTKRIAALKACRQQLADRCRAVGQDGEPCWIGQATPMEKVMPKSTFDVRAADRFSIRLARGESEATQVVVLPNGNRNLVGVSVEVGELKASDGTVLPASAISAHPVGYVETKNPGPYAAGCNVATNLPGGYWRQKRPVETGWYPEPIMTCLAKTDVAPGVAQSFWVNCRAPRDQRKGVYSGVLTVKGEGFAKTFPIDVRVYGFEVPVTSPLPLAVSFHPGGNPPYAQGFDAALADRIGKDPESPLNSWSRHRTEWADFLADHYVSPDHLYGTRNGWWEELVRLKREGRLGRFNLGFWVPVLGRQEPTEAQVASNIVEQVAHLRPQYQKAKELGLLDHAYIYGCDECPAYFFRRVNPVLAAFRREFPGVKLLTTTYDESFGTATNSCQFDAYTPTTDRYAALVDRIPAGRAIGKEVWWYIACNQRAPLGNPFIEDQLIAFRQLMGAQAVKFRPDGFLYYQISIWNSLRPISGENVFTDWNPISFSTIHGDGNLLCCGPGGTPLTTVRFEAFRDGLEDYAYAKEYERVTGRTCVVPPEVCRGIDQYTDSPSAYYAWRDGLAEAIERADATRAGGWCYKVGACEAWQLKLTVDESNAALCKVGWPGVFEYPSVEPECFWSEAPVDGYDFIPGERDVPPHRCVRPVHEVIPVRKGRLYDLGREEIGFVVCKAKERPKLFVGESEEEANNDDWNGFEQVTVMDRAENGEWRSKYPLALRYFRFDGKESDVRFLSQVDRREPKIRYQAPNERASRIWRTAVETLRLSTRTFLLDGPKRDRLPWMGDFVVSCLANAHSFADPEPCRRSLVAVGTPARLGHVNGIGAYSLWWVVGHDLVQQKFPDMRFLRLHYPRIRERVDAFDRHVDERGYYVKDLQWNFLDWTDSKGGELKSETTLQVIYFAALKSAVRLAGQADDAVSAKAWNAKAEALRARLLAQGMDGTRHARALAIVFDLVDGDEARKYAAEIASGKLPPTVTPYMSTMEVWALMKAGETEAARRKFDSVWGVMSDRGVDAFWEGFDPAQRGGDRLEYYARPFGKSLCHAWSAGPAFLLPMFPALAERPLDNAVCAMPPAAVAQDRFGYSSWWAAPGYWQRRNELKSRDIRQAKRPFDLVLVGDSITQNWEGWVDGLSKSNLLQHIARGRISRAEAHVEPMRNWTLLTNEFAVLNLGISGDDTRHVIWRLTKGRQLDGYRARYFAVMVGTNNSADTPEDVAVAIGKIVRLVLEKHPEATVLLHPIFPCGRTPNDPRRQANESVNRMIRRLADGRRVVWCDFNARLVGKDGVLSREMMSDYLHPGECGYAIWREELLRHLRTSDF